MRTVFVQAGFDAGGAEKIVAMLARHRLAQGDRVDVVALNAADTSSFFPYDEAVTRHALGAPAILHPAAKALRLHRLLRRLQPTTTVSFLTKVNILTAAAARGLPTGLVLSERNNFTLQAMHPLWRLAALHPPRRAVLVMQTEAAREALPERLRGQALVIPNPVSAETTPVPAKAAHAFVAAGRLDRQKGFDVLLQAFARIAPRLPEARLTIFGEGPERGALEREVQRLGLAGRVALPGVARSRREWLAAGEVFVLASRFEGFPNVLLEALAAGRPVVAADCPWGPAEILRPEPAFPLVPVGDPAALGLAMRRLAADAGLRRRLSAAGPRLAARYFEPHVFAEWDAAIERAAYPTTVGSGGLAAARLKVEAS